MKLEARGINVLAGDRAIVTEASLAIESGEFVGLIGPNGAGKSTLLRAVLGLQAPVSGEVQLDGIALSELPSKERARRIAFLPQERRVEWRLTGHDVVMLGRYPHQRGLGRATTTDHIAVERALNAVEMKDIAQRTVAVMSGGERSRILLARALAVEAPLLLADEPITALDPYQQLHVMEILQERAREGVGVLAVMHDLSLAARFMDRLVLMSEGRVVAQGSPEIVLSSQHLRDVYRVDALRGEEEGRAWVLPWTRTND